MNGGTVANGGKKSLSTVRTASEAKANGGRNIGGKTDFPPFRNPPLALAADLVTGQKINGGQRRSLKREENASTVPRFRSLFEIIERRGNASGKLRFLFLPGYLPRGGHADHS